MLRTVLAFTLAPLVPALATVRDAGPSIALVYAYFLTYLFGVPLFFWLRKRRLESHAAYAIGGAASAGFIGVGLFLLSMAQEPKLLILAAFLVAVGAVEGLCFSLIRGPKNA
jgi:hypothetical protein